MPRFRLTRTFTEEEKDVLESKVALALEKFPELDDREVVVGKRVNRKSAGVASGTDYIRVIPEATYNLLGHELTHLIQTPFGRIPFGEVVCDVYTIARDELFLDAIPSRILESVLPSIPNVVEEIFPFYVDGTMVCSDDGISRGAKKLALYELMKKPDVIRTADVSPYLTEILENPLEKEAFMDYCIKLTKSKIQNDSRFSKNLACYFIEGYVNQRAKEIQEQGVTKKFVEQYKTEVNSLPSHMTKYDVQTISPKEALLAAVLGDTHQDQYGLEGIKILD